MKTRDFSNQSAKMNFISIRQLHATSCQEHCAFFLICLAFKPLNELSESGRLQKDILRRTYCWNNLVSKKLLLHSCTFLWIFKAVFMQFNPLSFTGRAIFYYVSQHKRAVIKRYCIWRYETVYKYEIFKSKS